MRKRLTTRDDKALLGTGDAGRRQRGPAAAAAADFLTVDDWAARLQVSKRTIFRMIDERTIPPYDVSIGKVRRWHLSTYERWVADHRGGN